MDDATFWGLIERLDWTHEGDDERVVAPLVKALSDMPDRDIAGFADQLARKLFALDGRAWARESGSTIWWGEPRPALGRRVPVRAARGRRQRPARSTRPSSPIRRRCPRTVEFESLLYVASTAYERKTGLDDDGSLDSPVSFETFANEAGWPAEA